MNQQLATALADLPGFPMAATKPAPAHSRRCSVCRHPDRIWIELKFIEWDSPTQIAEQFDLYDPDCIYHHAHASNLFELRRRNILCIYEHLLERIKQTPITSHGLMLAIDRMERTLRSRQPDPATEIETTITRDAELIFDPQSAWGENDQDYEEQDQGAHQQGDAETNSGEPDNATPESAAQSSNSGSLERQHTPAHTPHSKQPKTPEPRRSLRERLAAPNLTAEDRAEIINENYRRLFSITGPEKRKPPH
jgi:hypothetical protein